MFFLSASPDTSPWLSTRERSIITLTNEADRALKAREDFSTKQIKSAFTDWRTYVWGLMYFTNYIPVYSVVLGLPTVVTGLGYTGTGATVMAVWPYFLGFAVVLIAGWTTDRWGGRFVHYCASIVVVIVALIVLMIVESDRVRYAMFFLVMFMCVLRRYLLACVLTKLLSIGSFPSQQCGRGLHPTSLDRTNALQRPGLSSRWATSAGPFLAKYIVLSGHRAMCKDMPSISRATSLR